MEYTDIDTEVLNAALKLTSCKFLEWVHKNNDWEYENKKWKRWDDNQYFTTQQLFEMFLKDCK